MSPEEIEAAQSAATAARGRRKVKLQVWIAPETAAALRETAGHGRYSDVANAALVAHLLADVQIYRMPGGFWRVSRGGMPEDFARAEDALAYATK